MIRRAAASMLVALAAILPASAADDIFAALTEMPNVESTYVSGRFSHNKRNWYSNDGSHSVSLRNGFSALYSYRCLSKESVAKARGILKNYLKKHPEMEVMMKTVQGMQEYIIYESFISDKKVSRMIIWSSDAPNMAEVVVIDWDEGLDQTSYGPTDSDRFGIWGMDLSGMRVWSESFGREIAESLRASLAGLGNLGNLENLENLGNLEVLGNLESLENLKELKLQKQ